MIEGLFETHLFVKDLKFSSLFYKDVLGLEIASEHPERAVNFFWIGAPGKAMLGLWQKPETEIQLRHFAFEVKKEFILHDAKNFLLSKNLKPYNFSKSEDQEPMVFAWMPALALYFDDPDGHVLEFIAMLDGPSKQDWGVISYQEWEQRINQ